MDIVHMMHVHASKSGSKDWSLEAKRQYRAGQHEAMEWFYPIMKERAEASFEMLIQDVALKYGIPVADVNNLTKQFSNSLR